MYLASGLPNFKQDRQATATERSCHHTRVAQHISHVALPSFATHMQPYSTDFDQSTIISATRQQWLGLLGEWSIDSHVAEINHKPYLFILLSLHMGNGGTAIGMIAFAKRHQPTPQHLQTRVAMWCGYAIASEVARIGGYPLAGQPPEHFRVTSGRRARQNSADATIGLRNILRIGDVEDLGDGLKPVERAEQTLQLFLGEQLYMRLETQGFLDVSSVRYGEDQRVYRLRRDPGKRHERRVRMFEHGQYLNDLCIIRAQSVPEADHFLSIFLQFLSDEDSTLSVVNDHNIFGPYSDGHERETIAPVWHPRFAG